MNNKKRSSSSVEGGGFEDPPREDLASSENETNDDFDDPFSQAEENQAQGDDSDVGGDPAEAVYSQSMSPHIPDQVLQAKERVEAFLKTESTSQSSAYSLGSAAGIVGVGVGYAERDLDQIAEAGPGTPTLNLYVAEPIHEEQARAMLFDDVGVQAVQDDNMAVNVYVTGPIDALANRAKVRPAPGGFSIGNARVNSAGTLGCLARGRQAPRNNRVLLLTNNHVAALSNAGRYGDPIVQPGRLDGGVNPRDRIAILERFITIFFDGRPNYVDCATGWCWHQLVRPDIGYVSGGTIRTFRVASTPVPCARNMLVGKSGRTTQLRSGRVLDCNATIRVNYGSGKVALFRDQITIQGTNGLFSQPGDSGSLVWTWDARRNPVGLLFAGGGNLTFANKIGRVLSALDINLYT